MIAANASPNEPAPGAFESTLSAARRRRRAGIARLVTGALSLAGCDSASTSEGDPQGNRI